jgi:hypothetical protein
MGKVFWQIFLLTKLLISIVADFETALAVKIIFITMLFNTCMDTYIRVYTYYTLLCTSVFILSGTLMKHKILMLFALIKNSLEDNFQYEDIFFE